MCEKQVSVRFKDKSTSIETALINYANLATVISCIYLDVSEWLSFAGSRHAAGTTFCQPLCRGQKPSKSRPQPGKGSPDRGSTTRRFAINTCKVPHICRTTFHTKGESSNDLREDKTMKKTFSVLVHPCWQQPCGCPERALPAVVETTKIDSSVAQFVAASAASAKKARKSLPSSPAPQT